MRKKTREVNIGGVVIGGSHPIAIQSMCNTRTENVDATAAQILQLEKAGCDIVRVAVPTREAAEAVGRIRRAIHIPLVADIHFDYRLAIRAIENGADKVRINPGNIGSWDKVKAVLEAAGAYRIPVRVGVNSGSLEEDILNRYGGVTAEGLAESGIRNIDRIRDTGFDNLVLSIKASDVPMCIRAHELVSQKLDVPLHIGITEAGTVETGSVKSAVGLGVILYQGIGDTIRVSLTGDPVTEVVCARRILKTLGLRQGGIEIVSCPTCGRTRIDLISLAQKVTELCEHYDKNLKIAVMGCVVNGPGEAREADLGIAGGDRQGIIFRKGEILRTLPEDRLLDALGEEIEKL